MAMKVLWTPNANRSYEYIMTCATDYYGKSLLRKLVSDIQRAEMLLADNPLLGSMEPLAANRNFDYRYIVLMVSCPSLKLFSVIMLQSYNIFRNFQINIKKTA